MFLFCLLYINHHVLAKQSIQHLLSLQSWSKYFLCFCNSLSSYIRKDINFLFLPLSPSLIFNVLIYQVILGNIKTNSFIPSSKYVIKYLELFFVSTNVELAIFINIKIPNFYHFFAPCNSSFATFISPSLHIIILSKKFCLFFLAN